MRSSSLVRIALASLIALAGCGAPTAAPHRPAAHASATPSRTPTSDTPAPAKLISTLIEPDAGMGAIYALIASARHELDLTMYELEDTRAEQLLAADSARGVDVRVLLNHTYTESANAPAFSYLEERGVHVRWASSLYALTHQKALVMDGSVSVIMTMNWTSRYYASTRDVAIIDRVPSDVAAIETTFNADYSATRLSPPTGADLVWSPTTSLDDLLALINDARSELDVENEEMAETSITAALIAAAHRGVNVEICMTDSASWAGAFAELSTAGVHVRVFSPDAALYIHAKVLVRDPGAGDAAAFVGSQNFSTESLRYNRELGIVLDSQALVQQLGEMIRADSEAASPRTG